MLATYQPDPNKPNYNPDPEFDRLLAEYNTAQEAIEPDCGVCPPIEEQNALVAYGAWTWVDPKDGTEYWRSPKESPDDPPFWEVER